MQADERAGVRAVDRPPRRTQAAQPLAEDAQRLGAVLVDVDAERAHGRRSSPRCRPSGRTR